MNIQDTIKAVVILYLNGQRSLGKYFDDNINERQMERKLFAKTKTPTNELFVLDDKYLVVHKFVVDHHYYVIGKLQENPLILDDVLGCLVDTIVTLSRNKINGCGSIDSTSIDQAIIVLDEIFSDGLIYEIDGTKILERISKRTNNETRDSIGKTAKRLFGMLALAQQSGIN